VKQAFSIAGAAFFLLSASGAAAPPIALSVSPSRLALVAPASRTIVVRNDGAKRVAVDVARRPLGADASGEWLRVRPSRVVLRAGASAVLTLHARRVAQASAGDHQLRLLFSARSAGESRIAVRLRLGVAVRIRVPGRIARFVDVRGLRVRKQSGVRVLLLRLVNRGNATEQLRGRVSVTLLHDRRVVSRLRPRAFRELFPGARTVIAMRYAGRVRGLVTALATVDLGRGARRVERRFRLRL
jgi:hypothetical protein